MNPAASVGQKGVTQALIEEIETAFGASELIKVKFNDFKEKQQKVELSEKIAQDAGCHIAGMIGHVVIMYRPHKNEQKRIIKLPTKEDQ